MTSLRRAGSGLVACLSLSLPACDEPSDADEPGACFPLPTEDFRRSRPPEEETQGMSLQGGRLPDEDVQGASLQGGRRPEEDIQGASLQGGRRPEEDPQGASLQGGRRSEEDVQGTSLQGGRRPDEDAQGTSLQGGRRPDPELQGASLQGGRRPDDEGQGTSLLGGRKPEEDLQGSSLQGGRRPDEEGQGTSLHGGPRRPEEEPQGRYLGLDDLNGVRLRLAATDERVQLRDGQLTAPGHGSTASLLGVELRASTRDGRELSLQVSSVGDGLVGLVVDGESVCAEDSGGVFVGGSWADDGAHVDDLDALTFACDDGVIAKCVAWGYAPWTTDAEVHQACTRLARADYCGDGISWTLDGTIIDAYDRIGIQDPVPDAKFHFEAAWDTQGAVCVSRTRYDVRDESDRAVLPSCLAALPVCDSIDDAATGDAVLANRSIPVSISACE
jgi:ADYC domain-containing protein